MYFNSFVCAHFDMAAAAVVKTEHRKIDLGRSAWTERGSNGTVAPTKWPIEIKSTIQYECD